LQLNLNFDIFKPKAPPLFGMDISSSSVKLVELADAGRGNPRVERYAIEALPKDAVLDGNITNLDAVVDAVQRGWKRMATRTKNVALALPTAAVITKKIIVPAGLRDWRLKSKPRPTSTSHSRSRRSTWTFRWWDLLRRDRKRSKC